MAVLSEEVAAGGDGGSDADSLRSKIKQLEQVIQSDDLKQLVVALVIR